MTINVLTIAPNDIVRLVPIDATVEGIKAEIDGWLEAVGGEMGESGFVMYGDEEGRLKGRAPNLIATMLLKELRPDLRIVPVGTVVVTGTRYAGEESGYIETDVPRHIVDWVSERVKVHVHPSLMTPENDL